MNSQPFMEIMRIRLSELAAFPAGLGWNRRQLFFSPREDISVTLLQIASTLSVNRFFRALRDVDAGLLQQALHVARPGIVVRLDNEGQLTQ